MASGFSFAQWATTPCSRCRWGVVFLEVLERVERYSVAELERGHRVLLARRVAIDLCGWLAVPTREDTISPVRTERNGRRIRWRSAQPHSSISTERSCEPTQRGCGWSRSGRRAGWPRESSCAAPAFWPCTTSAWSTWRRRRPAPCPRSPASRKRRFGSAPTPGTSAGWRRRPPRTGSPRCASTRREGHAVWLLTSSSPYASECAVRQFGLDGHDCTIYELADGRFTGRPRRPDLLRRGQDSLGRAPGAGRRPRPERQLLLHGQPDRSPPAGARRSPARREPGPPPAPSGPPARLAHPRLALKADVDMPPAFSGSLRSVANAFVPTPRIRPFPRRFCRGLPRASQPSAPELRLDGNEHGRRPAPRAPTGPRLRGGSSGAPAGPGEAQERHEADEVEGRRREHEWRAPRDARPDGRGASAGAPRLAHDHEERQGGRWLHGRGQPPVRAGRARAPAGL